MADGDGNAEKKPKKIGGANVVIHLPDGAQRDANALGGDLPPVHGGAPAMFPNLGKRVATPQGCHVQRTDPVYARGYVGMIYDLVGLDDEVIKRNYGGGVYRLEVRDENGRPIPGGVKTVTVPGEPKGEVGAKGSGAGGGLGAVLARESAAWDERLSRLSQENEQIIARRKAEADAELARERERRELASKEAEEKHKRELERVKLEGQQEKERLREEREERDRRYERDLKEKEAAYARERERDKADRDLQRELMQAERVREQANMEARERMTQAFTAQLMAAMQSNQSVVLKALETQRSDSGAAIAMFQQGFAMAQQSQDPANAQLMLAGKALETLGGAMLGDKAAAQPPQGQRQLPPGAQQRQLPAGAAKPAKPAAKPGPAAPSKPAAKVATNPAPAPAEAGELGMAERIEAKAREVMAIALEKGVDVEEMLESIKLQLTGEMSVEDVRRQIEEDEAADRAEREGAEHGDAGPSDGAGDPSGEGEGSSAPPVAPGAGGDRAP